MSVSTDKIGNHALVVGDPNRWQLLSKFISTDQKNIRSTEAMFVGTGCLVRVVTKENGDFSLSLISETLTYVPGVRMIDDINGGLKLVPINS